MNNNKWSRVWPHLAVIGAFLLITMAFFQPLLEGKVIRQHDVLTYQGASQQIKEFREEFDAEPLWTSAMFSGMPAYQISTYYPSNLISHIHFKVLVKLFFHPASIIFFCMISFYLLLLTLGMNRVLAAIGGFAFSFSSYFIVIIEAGHNTKGYAIAYMPMIIAGIIMAYRGKALMGAALAAFALALQIIANHLQITYYTVFIVIGIGLTELFLAYRRNVLGAFFKTSGLLVVAALLAVLANITPLLVTWEYGKETIRGKSELTTDEENQTGGLDKDYALDYSYGIGETMSLMIPNFKGGETEMIGKDRDLLDKVDPQLRQTVGGMDRYFGAQRFTSGNVYIGAVICFLFVLGLFIIKGPWKWCLAILTGLSILLAWGIHFEGLSTFFLNNIPGYNKFRTVSMILVIAEFTMPLLAFMTLHEIFINPGVVLREKKKLFIAFGLTGGLSLLMVFMPDVFNNYYKPGEYENISQQLSQAGWPAQQSNLLFDGIETARKELYTADALRTFLYILLAGAVVFLFGRGDIKRTWFLVSLGALIFIDLWVVNKRFLKDENFVAESVMKREFSLTPADELILGDPDINFRVMNTTVSTFNDATTSFHHQSIGGYHGAKLRRYQELIEQHIAANNMSVLNMLNTKYFIVQGQTGQPEARLNPGALGSVWLVDSIRWVPDADAEIAALTNFNPSATAVIDERFRDVVGTFNPAGNGGQITITQNKPNHLVYEADMQREDFAVFSEIYYNSGKGWQAYLDGKAADHVRVNYVLRGMVVPAGKHTIEFRYEPKSYFGGEKLALAGSILLLAGLVFAMVRELTRRDREKPSAE